LKFSYEAIFKRPFGLAAFKCFSDGDDFLRNPYRLPSQSDVYEKEYETE
jgi:hypothetical protein